MRGRADDYRRAVTFDPAAPGRADSPVDTPADGPTGGPVGPVTAAIPVVDERLAADLTARMADVETRLAESVANVDPLVDAVSRHLVDAGGKRLRPFLTLLVSELGTGPSDDVVTAATVVELTHLATLYHDDVMDSANVRRGAPAAHQVWGNTVAILTGDLLFARASALVSTLGPGAVLLQSETFERLCMGQLHETIGPREDEDPVQHYLQVLADKTASLLSASARYGATLSGLSEAVTDAVSRYGERLGVAFQLADDVLDLTSTGDTSGKVPGTDLREHVPTMPVLLLRERAAAPGADPRDLALLALLDGDLADDAVLAEAVEALRTHPVVAETRERAVAFARAAVDELGPVPEGPVKESLVAFAEILADRAA